MEEIFSKLTAELAYMKSGRDEANSSKAKAIRQLESISMKTGEYVSEIA
jgi:hypothetical protein